MKTPFDVTSDREFNIRVCDVLKTVSGRDDLHMVCIVTDGKEFAMTASFNNQPLVSQILGAAADQARNVPPTLMPPMS